MGGSTSKKQSAAQPSIIIGKGQALLIRAPRDGYRRAGVAHTRAGVHHSADAFNAEQLEQLQADPSLVLQVVDAPKAADADK